MSGNSQPWKQLAMDCKIHSLTTKTYHLSQSFIPTVRSFTKDIFYVMQDLEQRIQFYDKKNSFCKTHAVKSKTFFCFLKDVRILIKPSGLIALFHAVVHDEYQISTQKNKKKELTLQFNLLKNVRFAQSYLVCFGRKRVH